MTDGGRDGAIVVEDEIISKRWVESAKVCALNAA
jgi:hypothetical protein